MKSGRELYDLLMVWQLTSIPKRRSLHLCAEIIAKKLGFFVVSTPDCRKSALIVMGPPRGPDWRPLGARAEMLRRKHNQ